MGIHLLQHHHVHHQYHPPSYSCVIAVIAVIAAIAVIRHRCGHYCGDYCTAHWPWPWVWPANFPQLKDVLLHPAKIAKYFPGKNHQVCLATTTKYNPNYFQGKNYQLFWKVVKKGPEALVVKAY